MDPDISIILPIYNVEKYLSKCIESILNQTFKNFEIILVNDGSTDKSGDICDKYNVDSRVKVLHKKNGGVSSARNVGIKAAKGKYIGFVDPDDWIYEDMFMKLYNLIIETQADIAICEHIREINGKVDEKNFEDDYIKQMNRNESMNELFKGELYRFALWNKLYKSSCFKGIEFPEGKIHEDLATAYRLFENANKVVYTNYVGYVYVKRYNSILTSKFNKNRLESFEHWDNILEFMRLNYLEIYDTVLACFTYWSIDNMYYVLNQGIDNKNIYLKTIQKSIRKNCNEIVINNNLSLKYKALVILLSINTNLVIFIDKIRRKD